MTAKTKKTWRTARLGDVATLHRGYDLPIEQMRKGEHPVIFSNGKIERHDEYKIEGPGIVTGRSGTLGNIFYLSDNFWPHNTTLYVSDFHGNDPHFIYYMFKRLDLAHLNAGSGVPTLNRNHVHEIAVEVPEDRTEQKRIAEILSAFDEKIENNNRIIKALEEMAQAIFKEWFVKFRFPGHAQEEFVKGIPSGWSEKTIGDVATCNATNHSALSLPPVINYIDISSVKDGRIHRKDQITFETAPGRARRKAADGDITWSNVRPNLKQYALVLEPETNDVFSTGFTILTAREVPFSFLYLAVTTEAFISYLVNHATGSSYPALRSGDFETAKLLIPKASVLDLFDSQCEPMLRQIYILEQQNQKLAALRDLLLPRLMSGEIRV